ncbi:uncharacterized protein LOC117325582 [Pecten maximus]|uniref:uncharacterized protein LOC117325582 n=1 Tax=Pecten maximus TaxID=6579 RepID=UPI0014582868|nr:uncharacterized protein LOC117325582 [Pecten maximus]
MELYIHGEHGILHFIILGCVAVFPEFAYSSYNIALRKTASQSSVYGVWGANRAVDGVIGKNVGGGSCSSTNTTGSREAWWRVDLEQISRIKTLNVTYRELYPWRLSGFYLYVSNISAVDNLPSTGHLCYHDNITDPWYPPIIQPITSVYSRRAIRHIL